MQGAAAMISRLLKRPADSLCYASGVAAAAAVQEGPEQH